MFGSGARVAIKILSREFTSDPDRVKRFEREAPNDLGRQRNRDAAGASLSLGVRIQKMNFTLNCPCNPGANRSSIP
jgi:hypothetical protein